MSDRKLVAHRYTRTHTQPDTHNNLAKTSLVLLLADSSKLIDKFIC